MSKHTPGPWETPGVDGGARVICASVRDKARTLAHVYGESAEQMDANARLIAAAPDMAEALRMARCCLSDPHLPPSRRAGVIRVINAALERAGLGES